ncbi:MAG TPA: hypothetical protein DD811_07065 [Syntrophomonas sp.]|nr:hypothetical protein [Syntrophomonas sp.]
MSMTQEYITIIIKFYQGYIDFNILIVMFSAVMYIHVDIFRQLFIKIVFCIMLIVMFYLLLSCL